MTEKTVSEKKQTATDDVKYHLHPHANYIPRSPDEVLVRGGHLEGYSLIITDDTNRGLAAAVISSLFSPVGVDDVFQSVSKTTEVSKNEIREFLETIAQSGAIAVAPGNGAGISAWLGFALYGSLSAEAEKRFITVAGNELAERLAHYLDDLNLDVEAVSLNKLDSLERFATTETKLNEYQKDASKNTFLQESTAKEVVVSPDNSFTDQLIVCVQGISVTTLYNLNEAAVAAGAPVLYVQAAGSEAIIGPYVDRGSTACLWEFERQREHSFFSIAEYEITCSIDEAHHGTTSSHVQMSAVVNAAPFVVELALTGRSSLAGEYRKVQATTGCVQKGSVMRLPRCPVCLPHRPLLRNLLV